MLAIGKYKARALEGSFGKSEKRGTPFVRVIFEVTEGPERGSEAVWTGYFTEKTELRTVQSLRSCGCTFPEDHVWDLTGLKTNEVNITVEHEEYEVNGAPRIAAKVAWVNGRIRGGVKDKEQLNDTDKRHFAARLGSVIRATRTLSTPNDDTDIPF